MKINTGLIFTQTNWDTNLNHQKYRSPEVKGSGTSLKGGKDTPNLPSKKVILENRTKKYVENTLKKIQL